MKQVEYNQRSTAPRQRPQRLLIAEDHPRLRHGLRRYFETCGYKVATAGSFDAAIDAAKESPPDIAICDWQIDGSKSGADVARALQKRFQTGIVFVTGASLAELRRSTQDLFVIRYFRKPVAPEKIAGSILKYLMQAEQLT